MRRVPRLTALLFGATLAFVSTAPAADPPITVSAFGAPKEHRMLLGLVGDVVVAHSIGRPWSEMTPNERSIVSAIARRRGLPKPP